jgi:hypothetical protein
LPAELIIRHDSEARKVSDFHFLVAAGPEHDFRDLFGLSEHPSPSRQERFATRAIDPEPQDILNQVLVLLAHGMYLFTRLENRLRQLAKYLLSIGVT